MWRSARYQVAISSEVTSSDLERVITAAVKLYAAKSELDETLAAPISAERATPTEVVIVVSEMLRAVNLNVFDLAMCIDARDEVEERAHERNCDLQGIFVPGPRAQGRRARRYRGRRVLRERQVHCIREHLPAHGGPVCQGKITPRVQEMIAEDKTSLGLASLRNRSMSPVPGMAMNSTSKPANIRAIRGCGCGRSR